MVQVSRPQSPNSRHSETLSSSTLHMKLPQLPPTVEIERLVENFFSNTGLLFPYIHHTEFLKTLRQAKRTDFKTVRRSWLSLLYMILAMATSAEALPTTDVAGRFGRAENFYSQSKTLCLDLVMNGASVETGIEPRRQSPNHVLTSYDLHSPGNAAHEPLLTRHQSIRQDMEHSWSRC